MTSSPEGLNTLIARLNQGESGSLLTVASGRALAHMYGNNEGAAAALLKWASEAPDSAAQIAGEFFGIILSGAQPEKIINQLNSTQFRSKLVRNAVEQEMRKFRRAPAGEVLQK